MLFYSGKTRTLGEVHNGNTVTDYLAQERERGITICTSAVSFGWKDHRINLLDSPGHIDFTMEVEQSLGAVDGAIVILDSSAGVEAQTVTVWNQADRYNLPRIVFANKMDRLDADFEGCLVDLNRKLNVLPLPLHVPIHDKGVFKGLIDLLLMKQFIFDSSNQGMSYKVEPIANDDLKEFAKNRRLQVIDILSTMDDKLAETIINDESMENVKINELLSSIRNLTINQKIVPVLLGSAYKNTGVQLLMDSVINFLPAPHEKNQIYNCFENNFAGRVFKIVHDKQRGPLSLVRVFRGELKKGQRLTIAGSGASETIQRMYEPLADEYREIPQIGAGNVAVCAGLKSTKTGDMLVANISALKNAHKKIREEFDLTTENDSEISRILSLEPKIPDAVYFCSIEPPSAAYQNALDQALVQIQREDPSLRVKYDETTMQTVLGGMGELHLEIIKSRLLTEYKIDADLGPLQIAYKETIDGVSRGSWTAEKDIAGNKQLVSLELTLDLLHHGEETFRLDNSPAASEILTPIKPRYIQLIKKGALAGLERGPKVGGQVVDVRVTLNNLVIGRGTADSFIMAAASQCVQKVLLDSGCRLMEPIMSLEIVTPPENVSPILADMGRRRAQILDVYLRGENKVSLDTIFAMWIKIFTNFWFF
jgi:elongation factor G